jgi:hypothetical protein
MWVPGKDGEDREGLGAVSPRTERGSDSITGPRERSWHQGARAQFVHPPASESAETPAAQVGRKSDPRSSSDQEALKLFLPSASCPSLQVLNFNLVLNPSETETPAPRRTGSGPPKHGPSQTPTPFEDLG